MPESSSPPPLPAPEAGVNPAPETLAAPPAANVPVPEPAAKRRSPSTLNVAQERALAKAGQIGTAAAKPTYVGILVYRLIPPAFVTTLMADIKLTVDKSRTALSCDAGRHGATRTEAAAGEALVGTLRTIQSAARQKFLPNEPARLEPYGVGQRIDESRPVLESFSEIIIDKASEERPPGINTDFIINAEAERTAYVNANAVQTTEAAAAKQARAERNAMVESITQRRMTIQRAIDAAFPPGQVASAGPRKEFQLPANRPFSF